MNFTEINITLFRMVNDLGKEHTYLNSVFSFIAEYLVVFLALSVLFSWFTRNRENRIMIISATITFIFSIIIGKVLGLFYSNYQPFVELTGVNLLIEKEVDNSFPSDHTILFFSYCFSFWLFKRGVWSLSLLVATLVGISRIWVGVHYPFDVLTSIIISFTIAYLIYSIVRNKGSGFSSRRSDKGSGPLSQQTN